MAFDLCFNSLFDSLKNRIHKKIIGNLTSLPNFYFLLREAFSKISDKNTILEHDPIIDALYTVFCISPLDKEDSHFRQPDVDREENSNLFESYSTTHMLVSIYSPIVE